MFRFLYWVLSKNSLSIVFIRLKSGRFEPKSTFDGVLAFFKDYMIWYTDFCKFKKYLMVFFLEFLLTDIHLEFHLVAGGNYTFEYYLIINYMQ